MRLRLLLALWLVTAAAHAAEPIAIETLFRVPELDNVSLAPDGAHLAAIVPLAGRRNLAVVDLKFPSSSVIYRFADGQVLHVGRHGLSSAVFKADTRTGGESLVTFENPGGASRWVADFDGNVRAAFSYDSKRQSSALYWGPTPDGPWKELARFPGEEGQGIFPISFDEDNRNLIVASNVGNDNYAIYRYDPEAGRLLDKIYEGEHIDVSNVIVDRKSRKLLGIYSGTNASGVTWLDPRWRDLQSAVDKALPGLRNRFFWGGDDVDRVLVASYSDVQPTIYWLLDVKTSRLREVQKSRSWIDPTRMTPVQQVRYAARDGLEIPAYLAIPPREVAGKPPLVVVIHGGPNVAGNVYGFDPETQFLVSRGYAVLLPNFRGTTGYGRKFLEAGFGQWGRAMQDDITDGVRWAVARGLVDPERVCLFGWSYGGYAALMGLIREPEMFRCAVAAVAVTDPALLFEPGWNRSIVRDDVEAEMRRRIGDPTDARAFDAISPLKQAKSIKAPVLLAFGAEDRRVPIVHGSRMRDALEGNGTPIEWVMYPGEGHGFRQPANRVDFYRRVEDFLARNLGH